MVMDLVVAQRQKSFIFAEASCRLSVLLVLLLFSLFVRSHFTSLPLHSTFPSQFRLLSFSPLHSCLSFCHIVPGLCPLPVVPCPPLFLNTHLRLPTFKFNALFSIPLATKQSQSHHRKQRQHLITKHLIPLPCLLHPFSFCSLVIFPLHFLSSVFIYLSPCAFSSLRASFSDQSKRPKKRTHTQQVNVIE
jgi:hypothetical protein